MGMENPNNGETYEQRVLREAADKVNPERKTAEEIGKQEISSDYGASHRSDTDWEKTNKTVEENGDYT